MTAMFRLEINDSELVAWFYCEFCDAKYEWPFTARIVHDPNAAPTAFPDARHVIMSHHFGDENLAKYGFLRCPKSGMWRDTRWIAIDSESDTTLASGEVKVTIGTPAVTTDAAN